MLKYKYKIYTPHDKLTSIDKIGVANFLFEHLEEYGDDLKDIKHCLEYTMKESSHHGGLVILCIIERSIVGAVVVNKTGMSRYIPENILVYVAVHKKYRGKGIGKALMTNAIKHSTGDIALHVEPNNPAKHLYEKLGFQNKYLEMRYTRSKN
ncbi:MAG: ribosomal-protein-alanine N-acetyltransferase [Saprospiraceae bacterium]|jgi:ribosomal protein S18 acetylase RimI-like enzyme